MASEQSVGDGFQAFGRRRQGEPDRRRPADRALRVRDRLQGRGAEFVLGRQERIDEPALLAEPHHESGYSPAPGCRSRRLAADTTETRVGIGAADRAIKRYSKPRWAEDG